MIEAYDSAKRFGDAQEEASQVRAAGDRTRENDDRLVNFSGGGCHGSISYLTFLLLVVAP